MDYCTCDDCTVYLNTIRLLGENSDRLVSQREDLKESLKNLESIIAEFRQLISNPEAVHINILRGTIARPSFEQFQHLYPAEFITQKEERDKLRAALAELYIDAQGYIWLNQRGDVHHLHSMKKARDILRETKDDDCETTNPYGTY